MSTSFVHGKGTVLKVGASDISAFTSNSQLERDVDSHDVTAYGANSHAFQAGLLDAKFTADGTYDSTATTGSRAIFGTAIGTTVAITRRPEGTGTGKPNEAFSIIVTKYTESNAVADMVKWQLEGQVTGDVTVTVQ
nr:hypothetical protein Hi04_10k_c361_00015 [uncultured bacterium]